MYGEVGAFGGAGFATNDIMELISEEELSVCRSEGSPLRKQKKRKVGRNENAAAPNLVTG